MELYPSTNTGASIGSSEPMMPMQNGMLPESIVEGLAQTWVFRCAMGARPWETSPPALPAERNVVGSYTRFFS
jgi:hypothetical protein